MSTGMNQDRSKRVIVEPLVVDFLRDNIGDAVSIGDIMDQLPPGANSSTVRSVMRRLVEGDKFDIKVLSRGNQWRIDGLVKSQEAEKLKNMIGPLEILGKMDDGSILVRNTDSKLYTLRAL